MAKDSEGEYARYIETERDQRTPSAKLGRRKRGFYMKHAQRRGRHKPEEWRALRDYFGGRCVKCLRLPSGSRPSSPGGLRTSLWQIERDHIRRVIDGGSDAIENIQPLCTECNHTKGTDQTDHRPAAAKTLGLAWPREEKAK